MTKMNENIARQNEKWEFLLVGKMNEILQQYRHEERDWRSLRQVVEELEETAMLNRSSEILSSLSDRTERELQACEAAIARLQDGT